METPQEHNKRQVVNVIRVILIVTAVLFILLAAFFVFKVHSEGRMALREAKNIKLALITADILQEPYQQPAPDELHDLPVQGIRRLQGKDQ